MSEPTETLPEHERVYRGLRQRILDGELAPGDAITIRGLGEDYAVSMTPAREAVRRLVAERALSMSASGRVSVPMPDQATMADLFRARLLLEPELAARAAPNLTNPVVKRMSRIDTQLNRRVGAGDVAGYVKANTAFHSTLYEAARAPALLALVHSVWLQSAPLMRRVYALIDYSTLRDYHTAAIEAAQRRDATALADAIRGDVAQGAELLEKARLDAGDL